MTTPAIIDSAPIETADSVISSIVADAVPAALQSGEPDVQRDEKGRFLPKNGESQEDADIIGEAVAAASPAEVLRDTSTATDGSDPAPVVLPEGFVAVPKIEGRELATPFAVMDAEGELEPPALTIKFTANGKERTEPLDKVVKLAQMGVYNQERDQQSQTLRADAQQIQATNTQLTKLIAQRQQEIEALLTDDTFYLNTRAKFEQENTPEMRLQRDREQLVQEQERMQFNQVAADGSRFFDTSIAPAVESITTALPYVSAEEIGAKLLLVTSRHQVHTPFGSIIPPNQYKAVQDAIVNDILPWAQQVNEMRDTDRQQSTKAQAAEKLALQKAAEKAQADAQKVKNTLTKTARPQQGKVVADNPPPKKFTTTDDLLDDIVRGAVASVT